MGTCISATPKATLNINESENFHERIDQLDIFPPEIILHIMKYLYKQDLVNFIESSSRYIEIANTNKIIINKLRFRIRNLYDFQRFQESAINYIALKVTFNPSEPIVELTSFERLTKITILKVRYFLQDPHKLRYLLRATTNVLDLQISYLKSKHHFI